MSEPSNTSNKWTESRSYERTEYRSSKSKPEPYWRIPKSVGECHELTAHARCVYGLLASKVRQGNIAKIGQREMARRLGFSRSTIQAAVQQLKELSFIAESENRSHRDSATFELMSNIFARKQGEGIETVVSSPRGGRRLVTVDKEKLIA